MPLLKEIAANAAVAWSPARRRPELLALGARGDGGVAFENAGGEFSLVSMDLADPSPRMLPLGAVKTPSRFMSLAWRDIAKHQDACPYGVVAGGMADGSVTLWNPKAMLDAPSEETHAGCEIGRISRHKGAVNALQFNPHEDSAHLLASGGADGEVYVMSLDKLNAPAVFSPSANANANAAPQVVNEITSVAWNTQVNFILATGSQNGSVVVWDLKQKKPWCELRDPNRGSVSAIAWHPTAGLQIATASGDDQRPVVKFWDLRTSTTTPVVEFHDHTAGILSMSWCPNDPGLLMSCGKDNRTLVWDLYTQKTMYELPSDRVTAPTMGSDQFFGNSAGQRRWNVQWSPRIPAVASTCTLDGKVQVWGLGAGGNVDVRPPKWMRRPAGASFGFGGKLVTISNPQESATGAATGDRRCLVHLHRLPVDTKVVTEAEELDRALSTGDYPGHCDYKIAGATSEYERSVWSFMRAMFEKDEARQHLLLHLGVDPEQISQLNAKFAPPPAEEEQAPAPAAAPQGVELLGEESAAGAEDVFSSEYQAPAEPAPAPEPAPAASPLDNFSAIGAALTADDDTSERIPISPTPLYTKQSEAMLLQALLVGNFELAVNICLHYNQFADALLLATCGSPELYVRAQRAYYAVQTRSVMKIISAITTNELPALIASSDLSEWRQTLAIISTYAQGQDFPSLCDSLASRLEEAGDAQAATLCYMCAANVDKTVAAWVKECEAETKVNGPVYALHRFVEKVSVFYQASGQSSQIVGEDVAQCFAEYASLMAAQGRLDIAAKYACYGDASNAILRDRIFNASPIAGYAPPPFPFEVSNVMSVAPGTPAIPLEQILQQQQLQEQQQQQLQQQQQMQQQQQQQQQAYWNQQADARQPTAGYGMQQQQPQAPHPQQRTPSPAYNQGPRGAAFPPSPYGDANAQYGRVPEAPQPFQRQPQAFNAPPNAPSAFNAPPNASPAFSAPPNAPPAFNAPPNAPTPPGPPAPPAYPTPPQQNLTPPAAFPPTPGGMYSGPSSTGSAVAFQNQMYGSAGGDAFGAKIPQGTGVNPLAAAHASSRIATPPVDMKSQEKDGFVSSVGNKALAQKYGNETTGTMSPVGSQHSATPLESAPLGATDKVSGQDMAIVNAFNDLVAQVQVLPLTMMEQKQVAEILKSKDILFTKLNVGELSPELVARLHEMIACFAQRDFATAQTIYVALTRTEWTQHKDWLRGLKPLIHISMKRFR